MKRAVRLTLLLGLLLMTLFAGSTLIAPRPVSAAAATIWQDVAELRIPQSGARHIVPLSYRTVQLDMSALRTKLATVPWEMTEAARSANIILELPQPDGTMGRFRVEEYRMMEPGLAAQYPDWHTYHGQGVDDPTAVVRISLTEQGFHGMVLGGNKGTYYIDPYQAGDTTNYISYFKHNFVNTRAESAVDQVLVDENAQAWLDSMNGNVPEFAPTNGILRTYRLAVAATGEYTAFHGGTVSGGQAAIVTAVNRVNGVYEREVNIRMILVANNSSIVYTNSSSDPYTNNNGSTMLGQNISNLNSVIGSANYDIGHVFSTGGGGVAYLGVPCTSNKAGGVTGQSSPVNDPFYIDYVAHEMGHQWGAEHTFNGTTGSCGGGNRSASSAYEPGSGITIMAYAGICGAEDIAKNSIDTFQSRSYDQIRAYINGGSGDSCDVPINVGNAAPVVNAGSDYSIPSRTPFEMTGSATDNTPGSLTYDWQQYNAGSSTTSSNTNSDLGNNPILRPWLPETDGTRVFPDLNYILNNANTPPNPTSCPIIPGQPTPSGTCAPGQTLPTTNRTLAFRLVVRDNTANQGGVDYDTANVTVVSSAGPFQITSNNSAGSFPGGSSQTVTWNVAGTTASPISCATVNIQLSTDGGNNFGTTLASGVANSGSASVTLPNVSTSTARLKVKCATNIFFDINNANFTITAGGPTSTPVPPTNTPTGPTNTPVPPTNTPVPPSATPTTTTGGTTYTGTLSGTGANAYHPSAGYSAGAGVHTGNLTGPSGTDFDLYLQKLNGSTWTNVASGETASSTENISYNGTAGTYRWRVYSYSGSGAYTLVTTRPGGSAPTATPVPPTPTPGGTTYTGSLPSTGSNAYHPSAGYTSGAGVHTGNLTGTGADFDLYLQRYSGSTWSTVASSLGSNSNESVSYNGTAGTYRWRVYSYSGSGTYTLVTTRPASFAEGELSNVLPAPNAPEDAPVTKK